jgi:predicted permease
MHDWKNIARQRLASLRLTTPAESDLADEIAQHLEDRFRELRSGGVAEQEAYQQAMAELNDMNGLRAGIERNQRMPKYDPPSAGEILPANFMNGLWKDLRYAVRSMRRSPLFVFFVVLTLALGIGANATVFTLINTLILNPLPVQRPGELAAVAAVETHTTAKSETLFPISYADLKDYQSQNGVFLSLAGFTSPRGVTWQNHGTSEGLFTEFVTANYFSTLGLIPARGRFFSPDEDAVAGAHPVAVLNYASWQMHFGGAEDILGREILVNNVALTVIGIAPPHFIGVNAVFGPNLWIPAAMAERLFSTSMRNVLTDRGQAAFLAVGRTKPGLTQAQARANIETIGAALAQSYPSTNEGRSTTVRSLREVLFESGSSATAPMLFASVALSVVVGIVLLIACSNVANLLMARSAARQHEMSVRMAMGASRPRLVRQLLTESLMLGLMSGGAGLLLAYVGLQFLFGQLPGWANFATPKLDVTVFIFALLVSLATGLLFGTIPAAKASRANVAEALKETGRTAVRSRRRVTLANALLVGQVAFSFLLLVTAALFLRSIGRAYAIDPGFQTAHLAIIPTNPGQAGYEKTQVKSFYRDVRDRALRVPGVASVSWASNMPLWARTVSGLQVEGWQQKSRADQIRTVVNTVDRDYFETAGVAIESGRAFTDGDQETSLPVAIVNQKIAQDYWGGEALGKRIQLPGEKVMRQVVGVARPANYTGWGEPPQPCIYVPLEQNYADAMILYVRSKADPHAIMGPVEREVRAAGPQILLFGLRTGSEVVDNGLFQAKMGVALLTIFGLLALGLASVGLYGVLAYSVNQRRREIGLRMALGATRASVLRLVLREGMSLVLVGAAIGFAAALAVGRLLDRMLFGLGAGDPASVVAAALILSAVALLACYLPARWATRVDPLEALREA